LAGALRLAELITRKPTISLALAFGFCFLSRSLLDPLAQAEIIREKISAIAGQVNTTEGQL
jgi:hypothetical protein